MATATIKAEQTIQEWGNGLAVRLTAPIARAASLAQLFAASGGKLLSYYMTFGDYDFVVVSEGPYEGVAPSTIVTAASGSVTELKTTIAVPATEMKTLLAKAGKLATGFKPAGVRSAANA